LLVYCALLALLTAYPLQWLLREPSLWATLFVSAEAVFALLFLAPIWACFGLLFVWKGATRASPRSPAGTIRRCTRLAQEIARGNELFFSHGLIVATCILLLAGGAMLIGALPLLGAAAWHNAAIVLYALVLTPVCALIVLNRCAGALLIEWRRRR